MEGIRTYHHNTPRPSWRAERDANRLAFPETRYWRGSSKPSWGHPQPIATSLYIALSFVMLFLLPACGKEVLPPDPEVEPTVDGLIYGGLPVLQDKLFRPTCANAGCHDSTFEPDFRTLGSTYATLVDQPVIKNDAAGSYEFRVVPGDTASSQLLARMTRDIDGNSGVMPLALEPDSDYPDNRATYLAWVRRWILEGAKRDEG